MASRNGELKMKNIIKLFFLFGLCGFAGFLSANESYPYSPERVSLYGALTMDVKFGPPGYGESPEIDMKATVYILRLVNEITVGTKNSLSDVNTDIFPDTVEVQLVVMDSDYSNLKKFLGQHVHVSGSLEQGISSGDFLPVIFVVESIAKQ